MHAKNLKRDYQLYIALPDSYRSTKLSYPVLFAVDANYAFPVVRNIVQRLHKHAGMEEVIVIGLSYAKGETGNHSRRRDYTPTVPRKNNYRADMPGVPPAFGEAAAYGKFLSAEVFPFIASQYRANMDRKVFIGHSYGSLLGLKMLLSEPRTFDHYILGSPSLWFDAGVMFDSEKDYSAKYKDLPASVFFGIGGLERLAPGKKRSSSEEDADMVEDLRKFDAVLRSRRYPNLKTTLRVFQDEDHASVFPMVLTHGIRTYLKSEKK